MGTAGGHARTPHLQVAPDTFEAVVLAGGSARRLGGADKPALLVGERTLLDRVLGAVSPARTFVVGPRRRSAYDVTWLQETPPGGGPVAGLAAALPYVTAPLVAVLAADLPFLDAATITRLVDAVGDHDGALLVDADGRDQLLVGVWRTAALRTVMTGSGHGARLSALLAGLDPVRVRPQDADPSSAPWFDCDTEDDLRTARELA